MRNSNRGNNSPRHTGNTRPDGSKRRPEYFRTPADENPFAGLVRYLSASNGCGGRSLAR